MTTYEYIISERQRSDPAISSRSNTLVRSQSRRHSASNNSPVFSNGSVDKNQEPFLSKLRSCTFCSCCDSGNKIVPSDSTANQRKIHVPISPFRLLNSKRLTRQESKVRSANPDSNVQDEANAKSLDECEKGNGELVKGKNANENGECLQSDHGKVEYDQEAKEQQLATTTSNAKSPKLPPLDHVNGGTTAQVSASEETAYVQDNADKGSDVDSSQARVPSCSPSKAYEIPISPKKTSDREVSDQMTVVASPLEWPQSEISVVPAQSSTSGMQQPQNNGDVNPTSKVDSTSLSTNRV